LQDKPNGKVDAQGNSIYEPQFPYWFPGRNDYYFQKKMGGIPPTYCADGANYAFTEDPEKPGTNVPFLPIVLAICPITFEEGDDGGGPRNLAGIQPTAGTGLDEYSSQGMTLFHELFHLVLGGAFTPDNEICKFRSC
jgi:hypothetical protein